MPHIENGIYKKYRNEYREAVGTAKQLLDKYFEEDEFQGDFESVWDFFSGADESYKELESVISKFKSLLETQKFDMDENEEQFTEFVEEMGLIRFELQQKARYVYGTIDNHNLSDKDQNAVRSFEILAD
jgi:hypothetical protein